MGSDRGTRFRFSAFGSRGYPATERNHEGFVSGSNLSSRPAATKGYFQIRILHGSSLLQGNHDYQKLRIEIWFHDHFPPAPLIRGKNDPSALHDITVVTVRILKHTAEVYFCKPPVEHALDEVGADFELPIPPRRPPSLAQIQSPPSRFPPTPGSPEMAATCATYASAEHPASAAA